MSQFPLADNFDQAGQAHQADYAARRPALRPGCRLSPATNPESLLLIPEGALRLHGPGRQILELCDGQRTIAGIIEELCRVFPSAEALQISAEVIDFLERLQGKGAIEWL